MPKRPGQHKPLPAIEAFFTTALSWSVDAILRESGHAQCRTRQRMMGANPFALVMAAARTRWFLDQVERRREVHLCRYRPWYTQTVAPSPLDVVGAGQESLHAAGILPIPRFAPDLDIHHEEPERAFPLAA